jgi:hypothetical protein
MSKPRNAGAESKHGGGGSHKSQAQQKNVAGASSGAGTPKKYPKKIA